MANDGKTPATTEQKLFNQYAKDSARLAGDRAALQRDMNDALRHIQAGQKNDLDNASLAAVAASPGIAIAMDNPLMLAAPLAFKVHMDKMQHEDAIAGNYQDRASADLKRMKSDKLALTTDQQQIVDYVKHHAATTHGKLPVEEISQAIPITPDTTQHQARGEIKTR